jgi:ubiquinone/menaquinone biosynthesis C-methylase UbiE
MDHPPPQSARLGARRPLEAEVLSIVRKVVGPHPASPSAEAYLEADVVSLYENMARILPCERVLIDRYLAPGSRVLDLGVGAGRTTPALAAGSSRYVGLDFSLPMIERCIARYPDQEFVLGDAADLSRFEDGSFDVVVFSLNGIDHLADQARLSCLRECRRVLSPSGILLLARHNARGVIARPAPFRGGRRRFVKSLATTAASLRQLVRRNTCVNLWRGIGWLPDTYHGGVEYRVASRGRTIKEVTAAGFDLVETIGSDHPRRSYSLVTAYDYYAFRASAR